ncbi:MAG: DUF1292 domain-containing protein [Bacilli bacterium]|nr:DUF1292 domain-containing protein [Bacilli bacterium]
MEDKEMVVIEDSDGNKTEVELVTYLVSENHVNTYLVYSKGEKTEVESDEIIYISKIVQDGNIIKIQEIQDDIEWAEVLNLLKKIANV